MVKLSSIIGEIEQQVQAQKKTASDLSEKKTLPTISTVLGMALFKTAEILKTSSDSISYQDLKSFIQRITNA